MLRSLRFCCICLFSDQWLLGRIISQQSFSFLEMLKQEMFAWYAVNKYKIDMNLNLRIWIENKNIWFCMYEIIYIFKIYDFIHIQNHIFSFCDIFTKIYLDCKIARLRTHKAIAINFDNYERIEYMTYHFIESSYILRIQFLPI